MNKQEERKLREDLQGLRKELRYVTSFIGISYCQCKERESREDMGILNRDDEGYFFTSPSFDNESIDNHIDYCPWCGKKLFSFRTR